MEDHKISVNRFCPCTQEKCPLRGNCVLCVQAHLEHREHVPECMENIFRERIAGLANLVEYAVTDTRPNPAFWEAFDGEGFLKECIEKQKT